MGRKFFMSMQQYLWIEKHISVHTYSKYIMKKQRKKSTTKFWEEYNPQLITQDIANGAIIVSKDGRNTKHYQLNSITQHVRLGILDPRLEILLLWDMNHDYIIMIT